MAVVLLTMSQLGIAIFLADGLARLGNVTSQLLIL